MTDIYEDVVEVDMTIDGKPWLLIDAEVELSEATTPNYVKLTMTPDPSETLESIQDGKLKDLVGTKFSLSVDTELISERDTDADEDSLLFEGNLSNISATGENVYEGTVYDPSQQAFAEGEGTSILNQSVYIPLPEYSFSALWFGYGRGTEHQTRSILASELVEKIMDKAEITDYEIDLEFGGVEVEGNEGSYTGGYERNLYFEEAFPDIDSALEKASTVTESSWWFDKTGKFHFGVPRPTKHELRFITDTSAGVTTPPYQSVKVIGSGVVSDEGWSRATMNSENEIVVTARLATDPDTANKVVELNETKEPIFTYRNAEISTQEQAESAARKLVTDLRKQQANGTVTMVGFPEIVPFDALKMPNSDEQPMGGASYGVYKVKHRLNASDGFVTKVDVSAPIGITKTVVKDDEEENTSSNDYEAYIAGRRRAGGAGYGIAQGDGI